MTVLTDKTLNIMNIEAISPSPVDISRMDKKDAGAILKRFVNPKIVNGIWGSGLINWWYSNLRCNVHPSRRFPLQCIFNLYWRVPGIVPLFSANLNE